ncbi:PREDICTED: transcription factor bHLH115-like isoform X1 [Lupinus angustifolius]|uniref:transcription factor bHLH115-like isoform X1 n=1 Tax=Lupinus angustifolius TaxID=3871 RepID=UPI00092F5814|nr:PREDICTED: transcription factor bHLH115-like isoform X1 [Lupinus angustifolius]
MDSSGASTGWLYDYYDFDVAGHDFMALDSDAFTWLPHTHTFNDPSNMSLEMEYSLDSTMLEKSPSKRLKSESCASGAKACREKLRRDKLNERFLELSSILEPDRPSKVDKVTILSDAVHVVTNLRNEAQKLKDMNHELLLKVKELKAEKNELRDEKNMLKADKERLEQQIKLTNVHPSFLPHPTVAKGAHGVNHKLIPFVGYPGIAMWQFMSPSVVDTSKDHLLRPPVA